MHDFASGCSPQNQVHATRADIACVSAVGAPLHAGVACAPASGAFRLHVPCPSALDGYLRLGVRRDRRACCRMAVVDASMAVVDRVVSLQLQLPP